MGDKSRRNYISVPKLNQKYGHNTKHKYYDIITEIMVKKLIITRLIIKLYYKLLYYEKTSFKHTQIFLRIRT